MTDSRHVRPQLRTPEDFVWLINDFVGGTPGVAHALIVSADGLALIASRDLPADLVDSLSAMVAGLRGLCGNIAEHVDRGTCEHAMLRLSRGNLLVMGVSPLASLAVLTEAWANVGMAAHQMHRLVDRTGHLLTPKLRDDLRRQAGRGSS
ncbi:roadblock/LC7 domain-containing protein [Actinomadura sp. WMMB 499]|uniref:roadblock/LC7 domain-containing protein n=1 Tax=Actinomadura sp. WMMB 499 TaxID=1219491 RepID=UPI001247F8B7|nr:roadblock/LC7 domain-containing protein [Actinomadura sp. WMMB 499]QFG22862.1 roadblock/LC7 domain-containing protein [Actinomadura sp. WMMB 499]